MFSLFWPIRLQYLWVLYPTWQEYLYSVGRDVFYQYHAYIVTFPVRLQWWWSEAGEWHRTIWKGRKSWDLLQQHLWHSLWWSLGYPGCQSCLQPTWLSNWGLVQFCQVGVDILLQFASSDYLFCRSCALPQSFLWQWVSKPANIPGQCGLQRGWVITSGLWAWASGCTQL